MNERRGTERFNIDGEVFGRVKATVPARLVDISTRGAQVEVPSALRPAVECDVTVPTEDGDVRVRARVQRCRAASVQGDDGVVLMYRAGLEFLDVSPKEEEVIRGTFARTKSAPQATKERRRGPIKIRISADDIRRRLAEEAEREAADE
jgi:hypothetical protein